MKKIIIIFTCILLTGILLQSCQESDASIQNKVELAIRENYNLTIIPIVSNGVVTLSGSVETEQQKADIQKTIEQIKNVKSVVNEIKVIEEN